MTQVTLLDRFVNRLSPTKGVQRVRARAQFNAMVNTGPVSRQGGKKTGTLVNWIVNKLSRFGEQQERESVTDRAQDLTANNPHATSCIDSMAVNVVGTGLTPQSRPKAKKLGITEQQSRDFAEQAEWIYQKWSKHADIQGRLTFPDMQFLASYSMLMNGEYLFLPTMRSGKPGPNESAVRLALQGLSPLRMTTPSDKFNDFRIRDGVELNKVGTPTGYWIATPQNEKLTPYLKASDFTRYPAWIGHRPGVLHSFFNAAKEPERVRGVSVLAPAMKFFKDLTDYLDFELVGNIVASSFPVFIEKSDPMGYVENNVESDGDENYHEEYEPGSVHYGNPGEKPHILKSDRPSNTFDGFVETILRSIGASVGLPYEVVAKDFSKTNYSSARAALLEAWRVYLVHRTWLVRHFCQPVWEMVMEEAYLRGELQLPQGGPGFYDAMAEYCNAEWIGPARGHVDPQKEMMANVKGLDNNILTLSDIVAEHGKDWESQLEQRGREVEKQKDQNLSDQEEE